MRFGIFLALALAALVFRPVDSAAYTSNYGGFAPWPEEARGRALPRPSWMLVVPAHREPDGTLTIWDRRDEWTAAWLVPRQRDGMRIVALRGDTEDARTITAQAIDDMEIAPMERILRKYGAPAIALAVLDGRGVSVAMYVPGWKASWLPIDVDGSLVSARESTLDTIAYVTSAGEARPAPGRATPRTLTIEAWRDRPDGFGAEFLITTPDPETLDTLLAIDGIAVATVLEEDLTGARVEVAFDGDVAAFEAALSAAGLRAR